MIILWLHLILCFDGRRQSSDSIVTDMRSWKHFAITGRGGWRVALTDNSSFDSGGDTWKRCFFTYTHGDHREEVTHRITILFHLVFYKENYFLNIVYRNHKDQTHFSGIFREGPLKYWIDHIHFNICVLKVNDKVDIKQNPSLASVKYQ